MNKLGEGCSRCFLKGKQGQGWIKEKSKKFVLKFRQQPRYLRVGLLSIFSIFFLFFLLDLLFPFRAKIDYSQQILADDNTLIHAFLSKDDKWRMKITKEEISPEFLKTILWKEDKWFRWHPGVNPMAIVRATWQNLTHQKRVSGASTITMQCVRMLEPRERTFKSKIIEMFRAFQLEVHCTKNEILELYLNLLPYGGNIEGIKSAAYLYFGQAPEALSPAQAVTLAIIPNNPHNLRLGIHNKRIVDERNAWLKRLEKEKIFSKDELIDAQLEPLDAYRREAPKEAAHFAVRMRHTFPEKPLIQSFINRKYQDNVQNIVRSEVNRYRSFGITNAAVLVVDNRTNAIVAYLGSAGFDEDLFQGQVDGVISLRSPGSALKPFVYALAIDKGLVTPKTIILDIPQNFGGYRPQNYDELFRGKLPVDHALELSLNIPAVSLTNQLSANFVNERLGKLGFRWIARNKQKLGLSVVLGGCGVTLAEITQAYSCFAHEGVSLPLQWVKSEHKQKILPDTAFSQGTAWMITEILTNLKRPDLPENFDNSIHMPHIAWKTGTSYGRRDAWSIGYNKDYTVGVWVGNFSGIGIPELNGSDFATPILFKIFNILNIRQNTKWFSQPASVDFRLVCSESGLPPSDFCEHRIVDFYIPGVSPNRKCNHLISVFVNSDSTISYCRNCLPTAGYKTAMYPNMSGDLLSFYESEHIPYKAIPPHNPACTKVYKEAGPAITSITGGKEYILYKKAKQKLALACTASPDVDRVFWYINDKLLQACKPTEKAFFEPQEGRIKISCSDDKGRNTDIFIQVSFLE